ncbi:MAG: hypothetical protein Q8L34_05135 [Candidatus Woesearchaeota archaeon]|nr:hypothetical protein [Candidatus Woesearchaeota archaeon]
MTDDVHIRIEQPKGLRKQFLESALHASEFLQTLEKIQAFEQERIALKTTFTNALTDLTIASDQFIKSLPSLPLEFIQKQQQVLQRQMLQEQPLKVMTPRQEMASRMQPKQQPAEHLVSFMSPLEEEMAELKRKIQNLSI